VVCSSRWSKSVSHFQAFYDEGRALPSLARATVEAELWIHPADSQQRGIEAGRPVQVYNVCGQMRAKARLTDEVQAGVIWMRDGWIGVNSLTSDIIDPYGILAGQAAFDAQVEVRRL
jgi:anaerobic selenocysteine-containing dehydrogenase